METVRAILAAHPSGISRAGILAWAKLRIDPDFDEGRLDAELGALASEVVERDGFLWLASSAGAPAPLPASPAAAPASGAPAPYEGIASEPTARWQAPRPAEPAPGGTDRSAGQPVAGWRPADGGTSGWTDAARGPRPDEGGPIGSDDGSIPGWKGTRPRIPPAVLVFLVVIGIALLVTNLLGGSIEGDGTPTPATSTGPSAFTGVEGSLGPVEDLSVGDCIAIPTEDEFSAVLYVPCGSPHDAEVFFLGDHERTSNDYPDDADFEAFADAHCVPAFAEYTGSDFNDQELLDLGWFTPTAEGWSQGDRAISCYLAPSDGSTTSVSYRGANP